MRAQRLLPAAAPLVFASIVGLLALAGPASGQRRAPSLQPASSRWHQHVLFAFNGGFEGALPAGGLIADAGGTFYGTTGNGGLSHGVVFSLTLGQSGWTETVLHAFDGLDGDNPGGTLLAGPGGTLFGTATSGGDACQGSFCLGGTVYELTPPPSKHGEWPTTVLHNFSTSDPAGVAPVGALIADRQGDLYGAAELGGLFGGGTVFELTPPRGENGWTARALHVFNPLKGDGAIPNQGLIADADGALYGTTQEGGSGTACIDGCGTVFKLTPPPLRDGPWVERILYSFTKSDGDGSLPFSGVVAGADGSLYGTTDLGGADNAGIAYRLSPSPSGGWTETILHEFSAANGDGLNPLGGLIIGSRGALYGTTSDGGSPPSEDGGGIVFRLTPPHSGSGAWDEKILHSFNPRTNGSPRDTLFAATSGVLYGSTFVGGDSPVCEHGCGTIFALSPP